MRDGRHSIVANRAHHADVGGMSPGSMPLAREIYQEGIRIPPILLVRRGKFDRELLALILANVRTPEEREGDLLAQCMAIRRGEQRLLDLVAKFGMAKVRRNMTALKNYSERMITCRHPPPAARRVSLRGFARQRWNRGSSSEKMRVTVTIARRSRDYRFHRVQRAGGGLCECESMP